MNCRREFRKWLFFLVAGLFAPLAACERERPSETRDTVSTVPKVKAEAPASMDITPWSCAKIDWKQSKGANLSVLAAAHAGFPALKPLLPAFEALTGIRVGYLMVDETDMRTQRRIDLSSRGGVYDVVSIGVTYLGEAHAGGWLEDLTLFLNNPSFTDPAWFNFDDIGPPLRKLLVKENQLLAMPYSSASPIFWYRKDLFGKYGIPVPDTFSEIIAMKATLQQALEEDGTKNIYAFATRAEIGAGRNTWTVIPCIRAHGGEMLDENLRPVFNGPEAVEALSVYRDMITGRGTPPESESMGLYRMRELFRTGKLASLIVASDFFNDIDTAQKSPVWDKWDAAITPRGPVSRKTSPWAWGWAINSASRQKKAAWLFIQWATSEATVKMLGTGISPARLSAWNTPAFQDLNAPGLIRAAMWALNNATPSRIQTGLESFPEAGKVASMAFSEIFFGAPVQETLDRAVFKVEQIMEKGKKP